MSEQMTLFKIPEGERADLARRRWENAFQKWSDEHGMHDSETSYGACGYGVMCDYCEDNSYGRPCVRALNKMCREKGILINYSNRDFTKLWLGE